MENLPARATVNLRISGRVQGVGFRYFVQDKATNLGLTGWVRNLPDGDVECEAQGPRRDLEIWIEQLREGPPAARIDKIGTEWKSATEEYFLFRIR